MVAYQISRVVITFMDFLLGLGGWGVGWWWGGGGDYCLFI